LWLARLGKQNVLILVGRHRSWLLPSKIACCIAAFYQKSSPVPLFGTLWFERRAPGLAAKTAARSERCLTACPLGGRAAWGVRRGFWFFWGILNGRC